MTAEEGRSVAPVEVIDKVDDLLKTLPADKQEELREVITMAIAYQGPLPPPRMLAEYGRVVGDAPERIIRLLEKQTEHRISMEGKMVDSETGSIRRGQWMAFWLSLLFGVAAFALALLGHPQLAGVVFGTTIVGLASVFIVGRLLRPEGATDDAAEGQEDDEPPPPKQKRKKTRR